MIKLNNKRLMICSFAIILLISAGFVISFLIRRSQYTYIDNFNEYYYIPNDIRDKIFGSLHDAISINSSNIPWGGAVVRDSVPYSFNYNDDYDGFMGGFVVDIPEIKQTYIVSFNYKDDEKAIQGGYPIMVLCVGEKYQIYPDFDCKDNLPWVTDSEENADGEAQNE